MQHKKSFILFLSLSGSVVLLSRCINNALETNNPRGHGYAGSASCKKCHQAIYQSYITTVHYNTTRPASKQNIMGNFSTRQNTFLYNMQTKVVMEKRDTSFVQVHYINGKEKEAHPFDIVFGVRNAQTFLYWKGDQTFELPVSYYTSINSWATSPGFSAERPDFNRVIGKNCFECHSSYIDSKLTSTALGMEELLDKNSLIYGIDCERCHGPAASHVDYHSNNPGSKNATYTVLYKSLTRQQQSDACAVCHSGNDREEGVSIFKFKMRDTLANFFLPSPHHIAGKPADIDVHGSQYQLLAGSKCFVGSKILTCTTCHNPHTDGNGNLKNYSATCISCHNKVHENGIANEKISANEIKRNCIDCHMPKMPSAAISFYVSGSAAQSPYLLRTHKIAVYPQPHKKLNALINLFKKNITHNKNAGHTT